MDPEDMQLFNDLLDGKKVDLYGGLTDKEKVILGVKDPSKKYETGNLFKQFILPLIGCLLFTIYATIGVADSDGVLSALMCAGLGIVVSVVISGAYYTANSYYIRFDNDEIVIGTAFCETEDRIKIDNNPRIYVETCKIPDRYGASFHDILHIVNKDKDVTVEISRFGLLQFHSFLKNLILEDIDKVDTKIQDKVMLDHESYYSQTVENKKIRVSGIKNPNTKIKIRIRKGEAIIAVLLMIFIGVCGFFTLYSMYKLIIGANGILAVLIPSVIFELIFCYFYIDYMDSCYIVARYYTNYFTINRKKFYISDDVFFYILPSEQSTFDYIVTDEKYHNYVGTSKREYMVVTREGEKIKAVIRAIPNSRDIMKLFENCEYTMSESDIDMW